MNNERDLTSLIDRCLAVKENAYCPYSKFHVGAALITDNDLIFSGCNVENGSYGLTICAERTAIVKAISEGYHKFTDIAICSDVKNDYITPCGACREFIAEFNINCNVILVKSKNDFKILKLNELLPLSFDRTSIH